MIKKKKVVKEKIKKEDYPVATCTVCGKVTEIQQSHAWRSLMAQMKTYQERNAMLNRDVLKIHKAKNAQMYALYKLIGEMYNVMTEEQKTRLLSAKQEMRDAVRKGFDILLNKEKEGIKLTLNKQDGFMKLGIHPDDVKKANTIVRKTKRITW